MGQGGVFSVGGNGGEAELHEAVLLPAQPLQVVGGGDLGQRLALQPFPGPVGENTICIIGVLQEVAVLRDGDAVPDVGFLLVFDLHRVLDGLPVGAGQQLVHQFHGAVQCRDEGIVGLAGLQQNGLAPELLHRLIDVVVGQKLHVQRLKVVPDLCVEACFIGEEEGLLLCHQEIGKEDRGAEHVISPEVEKPGDVVEAGNDMHLGTGLLHIGPKLGELLRGALSGPALLQNPHTALGQRGAVLPDLAHEIRIPDECCALLHGNAAELRSETEVHTAAVKAQTAVHRQHAPNVFGQGRYSLFSHLHECGAAVPELLLRLNKVAAVGEEPGFRLCHHQITAVAGEAGDVFDGLEIFRDMLTLMEVIHGDQEHIHMFRLHFLPQERQFLFHLIYLV